MIKALRFVSNLVALLAVLACPALGAEGDPSATPEAEERLEAPELFEQLLVVGSSEQARRVPGSAHVITAEELERQDYADIHRVLRQTPGINIQEEDGYGLRPNIGIRGTGVERSQKVTLLEDGVLIAPAPYSAPSAYYSPTAGRMEGFEVRKGSGAIRQGPFTNGGALNYLSSSIPGSLRGRLALAAGQEGLGRLRASVGDSGERHGWLLETFQLETDGFKQLDGGGDTGFDLDDTLAKLRFNSRSGARTYQAVELKLGRTKQLGEETYLGLTQGDYEQTPFRRYAASAGDNITSDHEQVQISYYVQPSDRFNLTATLYRNDFFRNWFKLERVDGVSVATVLDDPDTHADLVDVLRGDLDSSPGALGVRNNRRNYYSEGLQLLAGVDVPLGPATHEFEVGLRFHRDQEDRFQEVDRFQMLDGQRVLTARGVPGSDANRIASAEAVALFVQDTFSIGRWTWTPGVRVESIDLMREDFGRSDPLRNADDLSRRANDLTEVIPGLGLSYSLDDSSNLFLGIHRGFSPPSPSSTQEVDAERSINYELGWRYVRGPRSAELVAFLSDYDNLLGNDTVSTGGEGTGDQFNGGKVEVAGLEAGLRWDLAAGRSSRLRVPVQLAYTYTHAEFRNSFESDFADWAPSVRVGDELPYVADHQLFAGISVEGSRWAFHLNGNHLGDMRTAPGAGPIPASELIGSRLLLDAKAEVTLKGGVKLWAQVLNATDEIYVAARRPAGVRPGRPRAVLFGLSLDLPSPRS